MPLPDAMARDPDTSWVAGGNVTEHYVANDTDVQMLAAGVTAAFEGSASRTSIVRQSSASSAGRRRSHRR